MMEIVYLETDVIQIVILNLDGRAGQETLPNLIYAMKYAVTEDMQGHCLVMMEIFTMVMDVVPNAL
jgi:hypothetical protein